MTPALKKKLKQYLENWFKNPCLERLDEKICDRDVMYVFRNLTLPVNAAARYALNKYYHYPHECIEIERDSDVIDAFYIKQNEMK